MDHVVMVGITHRDAALPLLERVAVPVGERAPVLAALRAAGCAEAALLSTCSRVEVYARPGKDGPDGQELLAVLATRAGLSGVDLQAAAQTRVGHAAAEHLFRVSAGLESRVLGEVEIQGQVRQAFRQAHAAGSIGADLGRVFPAALRCGARVRAETSLGAHARSLGHRAVDVGLAALDGLADPVIMVVGSGRMASSAVEHLRQLGRRPRVAARNQVDASRLVRSSDVCALADLATGVGQADLLICATSAAHPVVTHDQVRAAMSARSHPLVVVDLSVPRNVDTAVAGVPGVRLIDLEQMDEDLDADPGLQDAVEAGETIVGEALRQHLEAAAVRGAGPVIAALRGHVEQTCLAELTRVAPPTATADDLASAARAVAGRLLHRPTLAARSAAVAGDAAALMSLCDIFGVEREAAARWGARLDPPRAPGTP